MNPKNEYLEAQVMTASPHQLHLMVLDAAIRNARRAEQALQEHDVETSHFSLNSSRDCVGELISGLDPTPAPDLVDRLKSLFLFVHRRLIEADLKHDPQRIREALRILEMHRETWLQVIEKLSQEDARSDGPPLGETCWMS